MSLTTAHWANTLIRDYGTRKHDDVYLQLGGLALEMGRNKAPAGLQLVALATRHGILTPYTVFFAR